MFEISIKGGGFSIIRLRNSNVMLNRTEGFLKGTFDI